MTESKETNYHSNVKEFAEDFIELINENDSKLLYTHGIMLTSGPYEIHIFSEEENERANESLIQLATNRIDLLENSLEAENFRSFIIHTHELAGWLQLRGLTVGLSGSTFLSKLRLKFFEWFPIFFGG